MIGRGRQTGRRPISIPQTKESAHEHQNQTALLCRLRCPPSFYGGLYSRRQLQNLQGRIRQRPQPGSLLIPSQKNHRHIAINEIYLGKKHKFITNVLDLDTDRVLHIGKGIRILQDAARRLMMWKPFILNWYKHPISTAKLEATNRKRGSLQRNTCDYRDEQYLKLRIHNIHTTNYVLTG